MLDINCDLDKIDFTKLNGLIPACVQDYETMEILMLGFMNPEALKLTLETKKVHFYSRSRETLWLKGETSGHFLNLIDWALDCDKDSILIYAKPQGPTCHLGNQSCFKSQNLPPLYYLAKLNKIIEERFVNRKEGSYTAQLFNEGVKRMAQKVGEEGVEVALAALSEDEKELSEETADLLFHLLVLLKSKNISLNKISEILKNRMK